MPVRMTLLRLVGSQERLDAAFVVLQFTGADELFLEVVAR